MEKYQCVNCTKNFTSLRPLKNHFYDCVFCGMDCGAAPDRAHDRWCIGCGSTFESDALWLTHWGASCPHDQFRCYQCGQSFDDQTSLGAHYNFHEDMKHMKLTPKRITCVTCGKTVATSDALRVHITEDHKDDTLCDRARRVPKSTSSDQGAAVRLWTCDLCPNFRCTYGIRQREHNLSLHKELFEKFCRFCGTVYRSDSRLRAHQSRCPYRAVLKKDPSGRRYLRMWRRVRANAAQRKKMLREIHATISDVFLVGNRSENELLENVPAL